MLSLSLPDLSCLNAVELPVFWSATDFNWTIVSEDVFFDTLIAWERLDLKEFLLT